MEFHNKSIDLNKLFYSSHVELIRNVCDDLEQDENKAQELIDKYLSTTFTKIKAMKDPNKPKKPKSSYLFFTNDVRDKVREKHPNASMGEVSKIMGEMWQKLSEKDKVKYTEMASQDKERHEEEMDSYKKHPK